MAESTRLSCVLTPTLGLGPSGWCGTQRSVTGRTKGTPLTSIDVIGCRVTWCPPSVSDVVVGVELDDPRLAGPGALRPPSRVTRS